MKVKHAAPSVHASNGTGKTTGFRIASNAHAFQMLSSGLYSDKIRAVLREIGCNAADAHVAGGIRHVPFEVKMPNNLDPVFYVKDFGPGLSDEAIRDLYTTYFSSTKQNSDDFTGAFGLGSKSPFSYTDSFTVTSCFEGYKRTYIAHLDKSGSPVITEMDVRKVSADWLTGVMISFPVNAQHFQEFQEKAKLVYQWFTPQPVIRGLGKDWSPTHSVWKDSDTITVFHDHKEPGPGVLMGNVRYPLVFEELYPGQQTYYAKGVQKLALASINLKMPIGSLQVAASREELQYVDDTKKALILALQQAYALLLEEAGQQLYKAFADNFGWNRRIAVNNAYEGLFSLLKDENEPTYRRKFLECGLTFQDIAKLWMYAKERKMTVPVSVSSEEKGASIKWLVKSSRKDAGIIRGGEVARSNDQSVPVEINVSSQTSIYVADCDKAEDRLYAGGNHPEGFLVYIRARDRRSEAVVLAAKLSTILEGMPVVLLSSLPEVAVEAKEKSDDPDVTLLGFGEESKQVNWISHGTQKKLSELEPSEMFYLVREGQPGMASTKFTLEYLDDSKSRIQVEQRAWEDGVEQSFRNIFDAMTYLGFEAMLPTGFILVTPSQVERLKLLEKGLRPFTGYVREIVRTPFFGKSLESKGLAGVPQEFSLGYRGVSAIETLLCLHRHHNGYMQEVAPCLPLTWQQWLHTIATVPERSNTDKQNRHLIELAFDLLWKFFQIEEYVFIGKRQLFDKFEEAYPMLKYLSGRTISGDDAREDFRAHLATIFNVAQEPNSLLKVA